MTRDFHSFQPDTAENSEDGAGQRNKGQQVICLGLFDKSYAVQTTNYSISLFSVSLSCSKPEEKVYTMQMEKEKRNSPSADVEPQSLCSHKGEVCPRSYLLCFHSHRSATEETLQSWVPSIWAPNSADKLQAEALGNHTAGLSSARLGLKGGRLQHKLAAGKFSNNDITTYS